MNVALDYQKNCVVVLEIDLPSDRVSTEWNTISTEFQKKARLPGYRPGKAPASLIATRYAKDIEEEVKTKLVGEAIREAVKTHNLKIHAVEEVEKVEIAADKTMKILAKIVQNPEFELPDYKNITVEVEKKTVTDKDVEALLEYLRDPHSKFDPVTDRPLAMGDYAVVTYEGTVEGEPISQIAPKAPAQIQGRRNAWVLMDEGTLIPGFAKAIEGMEIAQERTFALEVPESFPVEELRNRQVTYAVTLHAINTRTPAPLDDELAAKIEPGQTLEGLRKKIRERQEENAAYQFEMAKRNAVVTKLLSLFTCELPERLVESETNYILKDIVGDSQARGISDEEIKAHTQEIIQNASQTASNRVRSNFLLARIADEEKIEETDAEVYSAVLEMAERQQTPVKKLAGELARGGGINRLRDQIRMTKALDLLASGATVTQPAASQAV
ncbi:MAG: trigger factor [Spartobacteria bacterium AMD-G4]|nr:MAG: trigger factor [Spartobacteria bacterium AMD-G4]